MNSGGRYDLRHMVRESEIGIKHHSEVLLVRPDYQEYCLESKDGDVYSCFWNLSEWIQGSVSIYL